MTTTVAEAVEELAGIIRLEQFHTFSLFECRRVITPGKTTELPQGGFPCQALTLGRENSMCLQKVRCVERLKWSLGAAF
jgi:hypothetical protein